MDLELTITVWDNRKAIQIVARILKVRSDRVSIHVASVGGQTFRALRIDGVQQTSETSKRAMEFIQRTSLDLPRRYRYLVEPQEASTR